MFNIDEARFLRIQEQAVGLAQPLHETFGGLIDRGAENLFFGGTGGAGILMHPAFRILRSGSRMPVFLEDPAELVGEGSVNLTKKSIVVLPSLSGTTMETLRLCQFARDKDATVVSLTRDSASPLAQASDHTFTVEAADDTSSETFYIQSLLIALAVMSQRGEFEDFDEVADQFSKLPQLLLAAKEAFDPTAAQIAAEWTNIDYHIFTAAGLVWPEAWYYGMCILEEMQWIRTRPVHASDFFHGTLELVEKGVSVVILKGEDQARSLADRVERFAPKVTDQITVIDTADVELPGLSTKVRELVSPIVMATMLERISVHLEHERRHPLETRRYYRRLDY